jgi:hypothetical protein
LTGSPAKVKALRRQLATLGAYKFEVEDRTALAATPETEE